MNKTILLLDGSEAINSSDDYQPNYLFALRSPLQQFVHAYLQNTTALDSLGVVVMRDGLGRLLLPCTTSAQDVAAVLEKSYFMMGGLGCASLENGLRACMAAILQWPHRAQGERETAAAAPIQPIEGRVIVVSASVSMVDPTDIFRILRVVAKSRIVVHVISLRGEVHVLQECAQRTGGVLYCPMNYPHLKRILKQLGKGAAAASAQKRAAAVEVVRRPLVPIGFPIQVVNPDDGDSEASQQRRRVKLEASGSADGIADQEADTAATTGVAAPSHQQLVCPQCGKALTSVPTTCRHCSLRICSAPFLLAAAIPRHQLCPPTDPIRQTVIEGTAAARQECGICMAESVHMESAVRCVACGVIRCGICDAYCRQTLGLCPVCVALPAISG